MSRYQYSQKLKTNKYSKSNRPQSSQRLIKKQYIHTSKFISPAKPSKLNEYEPINKFLDFTIHPIIKENLVRLDFITPTEIQDQAIPLGLKGNNVVGIANTGTGKTAAFAIPVLHQLISSPNKRALIIAPTRELAEQIYENCGEIAKGSGLYASLLIGGVSMGPQYRDLRDNPSIVIGTPGRIKDHIERRTLDLSIFNIIVLDEVDRMLDLGFINDIQYIINQTSKDKQFFFFSATLDLRVKNILEQFARQPSYISVKTGETSDNVEQNIIEYSSTEDKLDKLHDLLIKDTTTKTLIFDDTHRSVERLSRELQARGFSVDAIHGGKNQSQRQRVYYKFKDNQINILVATDVAARGLDVSDITHVINYSTPQTYEDYVHRIGRTGRAGKIGNALTFIESR